MRYDRAYYIYRDSKSKDFLNSMEFDRARVEKYEP